MLDPDDLVAELDELNNTATSGPVEISASTLSIRDRTPLAATVGRPYIHVLQADGGNGAYQWRITEGALPEGLSLRASTGEVSGRAREAGESEVTVEVMSGTSTAERNVPITVVDTRAGLVILNRQLSAGLVGAPYPAVSGPDGLVFSGGTPPIAVASPSLPPGLRWGGQRLEGIPTQAGIFEVEVVATDAEGVEARRILPLTVTEPNRLTLLAESLPLAPVGRPYSFRFRSFGASAEATFTSETLPPGLALTSAGRLDGTPTQVGRWSFVVQLSDDQAVDRVRFELVVTDDDRLRISPAALPDAIVGRGLCGSA